MVNIRGKICNDGRIQDSGNPAVLIYRFVNRALAGERHRLDVAETPINEIARAD